ncbi:MAG: hypothetical protein II388_01365, partial [Clostridia bacterium]|nr:hypothetical protein [Clostridia bacterium]
MYKKIIYIAKDGRNFNNEYDCIKYEEELIINDIKSRKCILLFDENLQLKQLGIPVSVLIDAMYRQVVIQQGLPFEITAKQRPKALDEYTKEEFDEMLEESCLQAQKGEVYHAEKVFIALKNLFIVSLPI